MEQHQVAQSFGGEQGGRPVNHKEECRKRFEGIFRETKEPRFMRAKSKIEERLGEMLEGSVGAKRKKKNQKQQNRILGDQQGQD
jgi:hypothetical protein